jgi:ribonuclease T2
MRLLILCLCLLLAPMPRPAAAKGEIAGEFDYYVLALSWSPNWCALEGDTRDSAQCDARHDHGWIMHGLWPQLHRGFPSYCRTAERPPTRGMTAAMADIMGTPGLAWHQWKKHGSCTGLSATGYFDLSRQAYDGGGSVSESKPDDGGRWRYRHLQKRLHSRSASMPVKNAGAGALRARRDQGLHAG